MQNLELFEEKTKVKAKAAARSPLADRLRPRTLEEFVGQEHLVGPGKVLRNAIEADDLVSMIFWGPPGSGKTTLAQIIAQETHAEFHAISAVTSGVGEVKKIIERAKGNRRLGKKTVLFIDEIHRFNKAQQDALLHSVEDGTLLLIGATTENPSFEVIGPLLSRCRVYPLYPLGEEELRTIIHRALTKDEEMASQNIVFEDDTLHLLIRVSNGDARRALNVVELSAKMAPVSAEGLPGQATKRITRPLLEEVLQRRLLAYDKKGEYHYDIISAFIKSLRGSDPDAALYWLARMLEAGEDPKFIARRMIILASEDIGNADPQALVVATSAFTAVDYIGMPEARIVLAHAATYLASAPKSNAAYLGIEAALQDVREGEHHPVPLPLRNAPTPLMEKMGYGLGYKYPHQFPGHFVEETYLPPKLKNKIYYRPTEMGFEKKIKEWLQKLWPKRRGPD